MYLRQCWQLFSLVFLTLCMFLVLGTRLLRISMFLLTADIQLSSPADCCTVKPPEGCLSNRFSRSHPRESHFLSLLRNLYVQASREVPLISSQLSSQNNNMCDTWNM